jgi:hypothetical protein
MILVLKVEQHKIIIDTYKVNLRGMFRFVLKGTEQDSLLYKNLKNN